MGIIESMATAPGTHPSFASSMSRIQCDGCGEEFQADCRIDGEWQFHNEVVGMTDYTGDETQELCQECVDDLFGN